MVPEIEMKPGDVVLFHGSGWLSSAIRRFSQSPGEKRPAVFNHVGIAIDGGRLVEALSHVVVSSLDKRAHEAGQKIMVARRSSLVDTERAALALYASRQVGRNYGWGKIAAHAGDYWLSVLRGKSVFFFRRATLGGRYPICSWIVAFAYAKAVGVWFNEIAPNFAQPDDVGDEIIERNPAEWIVVHCDPALTGTIARASLKAVGHV